MNMKKVRNAICFVFLVCLMMLLLCNIDNRHDKQKIFATEVQKTVFDNYSDEFNKDIFQYNKPYRIVGEASGNTSYNVEIISDKRIQYINVSLLTPDKDLKSLIGGYVVFDKENAIIRVLNEDKIKEYAQ